MARCTNIVAWDSPKIPQTPRDSDNGCGMPSIPTGNSIDRQLSHVGLWYAKWDRTSVWTCWSSPIPQVMSHIGGLTTHPKAVSQDLLVRKMRLIAPLRGGSEVAWRTPCSA